MPDPLIHILFEFQDGPWGGGNQFMKSLRGQLIGKGCYTDDPFEADVIFFNSHHFGSRGQLLNLMRQLKCKTPTPAFIHRVDGPIHLIRGGSPEVDRLVFRANEMFADATVFQTDWSRRQTDAAGCSYSRPIAQILNAADGNVFFPETEKTGRADKVRIVAASWASNARKGFDVYQHLDANLDFDRFSMTFVGNSPTQFKNIVSLPPMTSSELAATYGQHDIYITASVNDPCSNSLVEAISCGVPSLVRNSGGHPEIVGEGGYVFNGCEDVISRLEEMYAVLSNGEMLHTKSNVTSLRAVSQEYLDFATQVYERSARKAAPSSASIKLYKVRSGLYSFIQRLIGATRRIRAVRRLL